MQSPSVDHSQSKSINYRDVSAETDFSGKILQKDPENFSRYFPQFNWKGVVLAGGAVLSILRGEPVNDFDFWLFGSDREIIEKCSKWRYTFAVGILW